jgi:hypothetical protein
MKKISAFLLFSVLAALSLRATVLFQDSTNYPYANGCIEGQGQWYCYYPAIPGLDTFVTNNVLLLTANSTNDAVATPTNGWANPGEYNYASFTINVSKLPSSVNGDYFCQFQNNSDGNDCCHIFIDTLDTVVPGTYRLGIASFDTSFSVVTPPVNYPLDLATGITYTVVMLFDTNQADMTFVGSTLWINPSLQDYNNVVDAGGFNTTGIPGVGVGYVYGTDTTASQSLQDINITQIGFSPYVNAGISNVIVGTTFNDVNSTNLPVIGVQPQSGTNYSGNSTAFYTAASGVDLTYQWFSTTYGMLVDDNVNIIGSSSNVLVLNNLSATDNYYVVVTDAYGNTATSLTATNTVITTPTAPFFPPAAPGQASTGGLNLTNNLFTSFGLTNLANGTGPLTYQWYFAPTNTPTAFTSLGAGQASSGLFIPELEYPNAGNYYVLATGPDGVTAGPTNNLVVTPPTVATLPQLHELMGLIVTNIAANNTVHINTNGVSVSGYVSTFGPLSASSKIYAEFYMTYSNYGTYVFFDPSGHTNAIPAPGSYVTVFGPVNVFDGQLEMDPGTVTISNTPTLQMPAPQLANFASLATNALTPYGVQVQCSLVTFTNIYIYTNTIGGGPYTNNGGIFFSNGFTSLYMTEGPYSAPNNTNTIEIYVPAYGFGYTSTNLWGHTVPTYCYQITGVLATFHSGSSLFAELDVTRLQDFVTSAPASFTASLTQTNGVPTISWPALTGSTYSVYSATALNGPWTNQSFGLSYYPSVGAYTDSNSAPTKFYRVSTP